MGARVLKLAGSAAVFATLIALPVQAAEPVRLTIKDHHFIPEQVTVTAGEQFRIEVVNEDPTPAEFESSELHVEKIVMGGGKISVFARPLKPGTYGFFDDYHPDTTKGSVIAVAGQAKE
jgi:plastocyanin